MRGDRLDLPKGRKKRGEDDLTCALRELHEETGIASRHVNLVHSFRFATSYRCKRNGERVDKTVILFAAETEGPLPVVTPDHDDYAWVPWRPPHDFREFPTIHLALLAWNAHTGMSAGTGLHPEAE